MALSVVTRGYGPPGSAGLIVTRGYLASIPIYTQAVDLIEAIILALQADAAVAALATGDIWDREAPTETDPPFVVVLELDSTKETGYEQFDAPRPLDYASVQITSFVASKSGARTLGDAVQAALQDASLTFDEGELLYLRCENSIRVKDPDKAPDGGDLWQDVRTFKGIVDDNP